jgi:DNA polymerase III subunit gamma/tau
MPEADAQNPLIEQAPYRVLARKYRPQTFEDLIGQEAMVRTLRNAFAQNRIHQAYIFTGVRGVGKTTTARILARALNYETASVHVPSIDMPEPGVHCQAIMESRHVDVMEMDAASNTSIDNIREIIEASRYKPVSARTKVYIIDEVHMLSKAAFNGLLKTLEEPPPHVKFLFATTEIRKLPVTVLSRCQRFDLRRIEAPAMIAYLDGIVAKEGVSVDAEAMALITRASEGSMRDALSLLDQAIAHGNGKVNAEEVRASLGLADRARVIDLFDALMRGDMAAALREFDSQHHEGAEPVAILTDLAEFVHIVTRLKLVPDAIKDAALTNVEKERGAGYAKGISIRALTMAWQILLKGIQEVQGAARAKIAAEMVLVRLAYAADLPNPADVIREMKSGTLGSGVQAIPQGHGGGAQAQALTTSPRLVAESGGERASSTMRAPIAMPEAQAEHASISHNQPTSFAAVVALAEQNRDVTLQLALERHVRVMRFEACRIHLALEPQAKADLPQQLGKALQDWTGQRWIISVEGQPVDPARYPTIQDGKTAQIAQAAAKKAEDDHVLSQRPAIRAIMNVFPGAKIDGIRPPPLRNALPNNPLPSTEPDDVEPVEHYTDDDL